MSSVSARVSMTDRPRPTSAARVRALLDAHGLKPSRALGQNFLVDANLAAKIVRLGGVESGSRVVEVGAGLGALTLALVDAGATVTAIEIDRHLVLLLADVVAGYPVRVLNADALDLDWEAELDGDGWIMVSNLPYNVATPLVLKALREAPSVRRLLVMTQREVAERWAARPGSKAYGAVSVKVAFHGDAEVVARIPTDVFIPRPRVASALVRVDRHREPPVAGDESAIMALVDAGFATRRKMLRNALRSLLGDRTDEVLEQGGIDPRARAETLDLSAWAALCAAAS